MVRGHHLFALLLLTTLMLGATPESVQEPLSATVCDLSARAGTFDGRVVRVRGQLMVHIHAVVIVDDACPDSLIIIRKTTGGPDPFLCDSEELSERFGCPADTFNRRIVATFTGTFSARSRELHLTEMSDFGEAVKSKAPPSSIGT
jgi:hypothetical protein